ncbi:MAG TPA: CAP domain-containing protein [Terriglobales bacterium]|nr:CAP domain-containing protein [Terriglobales bacterium]
MSFVFTMVLSFALPSLAQQDVVSTTEMERQVFEWTNQERANANLPPLQWNQRLALAARMHSAEMVKHKDLSHQFTGEPTLGQRISDRGARFSAVAENVGYGDDPQTLQTGWMHSAGHRANILNPVYTDMGIGIVRSGNRLYATEDFTKAVSRLAADDFENAVAKHLTDLRQPRKLPPLAMTSSASLRQMACSGQTSAKAAFGGVHRSDTELYSFNFTASSANDLPASLVNRVMELPAGGFDIGACSQSDASTGFTAYRVLMVLHR